jgi:O-antigen/teichoic acid export membrane protein
MNQIKLGGVLSYFSLGLSNILAIIYTPFMLRMMGQSEYGLYALVLSIVSYLSLMDLGFGAALVRYISLYKSKNETWKLPSLFGMFISLYSVIGLACFGLGIFLYFSTDQFFGSSLTALELEKARIMIMILVIYLSLSFPFSIFGAIIIANEKFIFQKSLAILKTVITPALMIPLLLMGYKSVAMVVIAVLVGTFLIFCNVWFCFSKLKIKVLFGNFDFPLLKEIFWFSILVFAKILFERVYWSSGQFILGATIGTISVAIFSIGLQMKGYYESFSQAIGGLFLPRLTSMVSNKDSKELITEIFVKVGRVQFHILGFIMCVYILIGEQFIILWAGQNYISAYGISLLIMIPYTIPLIQSMGYSLVQAYNVQKPVVFIFLLTTVLTISTSFVLIDKYGAIGAAIALSIAIFITEVFLMNLFYWKKLKINIPFFWVEISKIAVVMSVVLATFYFIGPFFKVNNFVSLGLYVLLFSSIYFPTIYFIAMNNYEKDLAFSVVRLLNLKK